MEIQLQSGFWEKVLVYILKSNYFTFFNNLSKTFSICLIPLDICESGKILVYFYFIFDFNSLWKIVNRKEDTFGNYNFNFAWETYKCMHRE